MKRYIVFTGLVIGATIMAVGVGIVVAVCAVGDKMVWKK